MKKVLFVVALALAVMAYTGLAQAEPYISAYVGAAIPHDSDADGGEVGFDTGLAVGAKFGYWFTEQGASFLGLELDVMGAFPSLSDFGPPPIPLDADLTGFSVAANVLLRYPEWDLKPYAGAGLGWFFADVDNGIAGGAPFTGDDDSTFGWQLLAGVDWMISPAVSIFAEYKYVLADFDFVFGGPGGGPFGVDYRASHLYGGVTYHF